MSRESLQQLHQQYLSDPERGPVDQYDTGIIPVRGECESLDGVYDAGWVAGQYRSSGYWKIRRAISGSVRTRGFASWTTASSIREISPWRTGLQANEFKEQAFCASRSGLMYFGGINGFNVVAPEDIPSEPFDPPLVMTNFQIFNQEVPIGNGGSGSSPLSADISETRSNQPALQEFCDLLHFRIPQLY